MKLTKPYIYTDIIINNITKQIQVLQKHAHNEIDNVIKVVKTKLNNTERKKVQIWISHHKNLKKIMK